MIRAAIISLALLSVTPVYAAINANDLPRYNVEERDPGTDSPMWIEIDVGDEQLTLEY